MTTTILSRRFVMEMEIMIIAYHRQIGHRTMKNIYYENCIQGVGDSIRCSLFPRGARRKSINVQNFDVMDMIFFSFFFKTTKNILFSHAHHSKRRKGKTLGNSGIWWEFVGNLGGFPLEISQRLPVFPIEFPNFNRDQLPGKFPVSSYDSSPKIKFTYSSLNRTELQHAVTSLILLMYMPFF
jgi:hypothetical protein